MNIRIRATASLNGGLVTASNGLDEIVPKQVNQTVCVSLGNWALFFPAPSDYLTRRAVCYAMTNLYVAFAKGLMTHDAQAAPVIVRKRLAAFKTGAGSIDLPHDWFSNRDLEFGRGGSPSRLPTRRCG